MFSTQNRSVHARPQQTNPFLANRYKFAVEPTSSRNYAVAPTPLFTPRSFQKLNNNRESVQAYKSQQAQQRRDVFGGVLGAASGIATVAAGTTAGASLAPVAVGLGLGYGVYKLGEALKVW